MTRAMLFVHMIIHTNYKADIADFIYCISAWGNNKNAYPALFTFIGLVKVARVF